MWPPNITDIVECLKKFTMNETKTNIFTNATDTDQQGNIKVLDNTYITYDKCWLCSVVVDRQIDIHTPSTVLYLRYCKLLLTNPFLNRFTDFDKMHNIVLYGDSWPEVEQSDSSLLYKGEKRNLYPMVTEMETVKQGQKRAKDPTQEEKTDQKKITKKNLKKKYRFSFRDTCLSTWQSNIKNSLAEFVHLYISPDNPSYKILGWMFIEALYNDDYFVLRNSPIYPVNTTVRQYCENIVHKFTINEMIVQICENKSDVMFDNANMVKEYNDFRIYHHGNINTIHFKYDVIRPYTVNDLPFVGCLFLLLIKQDRVNTPIQLSTKILERFLQDDLFMHLSYSTDSKEYYQQFIKGLASATKQDTTGKPFNIFQDVNQLRKNIYYDIKTMTYTFKPSLIFKNNKYICVIKDDETDTILYRYTNLIDPPLTKDFIINDQFRKIITLSNVEENSDVGRWVDEAVLNLCAVEANLSDAKVLLYLCEKDIEIPIDILSKVLEQKRNSFLVNNYIDLNHVSKIVDQVYYRCIIEKNPDQLIVINNMKFIFINNRFEYISQDDMITLNIADDMLVELNSDLYLKIVKGDTSKFTLKTIFDFDIRYFQAISKAASPQKSANNMLELIHYIKINFDTNPLITYLVNTLNKTALLYANNTSISLHQYLYKLLQEHTKERNNPNNILSMGRYIYFQHDSKILVYTLTQNNYIQEAIELHILFETHKYLDVINFILQNNDSLYNIDKEIIQKRIYDWIPSFSKTEHLSFMDQLFQNLEYYLLNIWDIYIVDYKSIILLNTQGEDALTNIIVNKVIKKSKLQQSQHELNWANELAIYFPNKLHIKNAIHLSSKRNELMCILHDVLYNFNSLEDYFLGEWIKTQLIGLRFLILNGHVVFLVIYSNVDTNICSFNTCKKIINSNYDIANIKSHPFWKSVHEILFDYNVENIGYFVWYLTKVWNTDDKFTTFKIPLNVTAFTPDLLKDFKDSINLQKTNHDTIHLCNTYESLFRDAFRYHE